MIAGLVVLNNLDFGVPAALAGLAVVWVMSARGGRLRRMFGATSCYLAALPVAAAMYVNVGLILSKTLHPSSFVYFVRSFEVGGYNNAELPVVGLYVA